MKRGGFILELNCIKSDFFHLYLHIVKALPHLDDLANVCRFIKKFPNTFVHVKYAVRTFCIRLEYAEKHSNTS